MRVYVPFLDRSLPKLPQVLESRRYIFRQSTVTVSNFIFHLSQLDSLSIKFNHNVYCYTLIPSL